MAIKSKNRTKTRSKPKAKAIVHKKAAAAPAAKKKSAPGRASEQKAAPVKAKSIVLSRARVSTPAKSRPHTMTKVRVEGKGLSPRMGSSEERRLAKGFRIPQYNYMKPPGLMHDFQVGDTVEVYCDHEKNRERVRGWIRGIVVQVDNKLVAVQFRSNVFLTDGWMVPDRILWYPLNSEHMRPVPGKKSAKRELAIPEY